MTSIETALRTGYAELWRLLRWLVLPTAAYLALSVWVVIAAVAFGAAAAIVGNVIGVAVGLLAFLALPGLIGWYVEATRSTTSDDAEARP